MDFEEAMEKRGLTNLEREDSRKDVFREQLGLLKDDMDDCLTLLEKGKTRGPYTHLFNALERLIDSFLALRGLKIGFRAGREAAVEKFFGKKLKNTFRDYYSGRRGGMYDHMEEISKASLQELAGFFDDMLNAVLKEESNEKISKIGEDFSRIKQKIGK